MKNNAYIYDMIHPDPNVVPGFFANYFFLLELFIYCDYYQMGQLYVNDNGWIYSYDKGLEDYFIIDMKKICPIKNNNDIPKDSTIQGQFNHGFSYHPKVSLHTFKTAISDLYILNESLIERTQEYCRSIQLPEKYNSIYVRCGDKLVHESKYYSVEIYIDYLLKQMEKENNTCKNLFVNSDDHREVMKYVEYIKTNKIDLEVFYITDESDNGGTLVSDNYKNTLDDRDKDKLKEIVSENKIAIDQMNAPQKKEHTEKLLCAIEIIKKSDIVVLDYQSNVSRFIKLYCKDSKVYSICGIEPHDDMKVSPAYTNFMIEG